MLFTSVVDALSDDVLHVVGKIAACVMSAACWSVSLRPI